MERLEQVGRALGFMVARAKACKVRLDGKVEGRKGWLDIMVEVFKVPACTGPRKKNSGGLAQP